MQAVVKNWHIALSFSCLNIKFLHKAFPMNNEGNKKMNETEREIDRNDGKNLIFNK